ncbi:hypothetical protein QUB17_22470, partial [Microcoleus sp. B5-C4]|uniref:hypothetical protein n=1 Tax=Microcoleus sp. B5-C4 TaxID=2818675 RepID=UPI002FD64935
ELNDLLAEGEGVSADGAETIESRLDAAELQITILKKKVAKLQSAVGAGKFKNSNNVFDLLV